MKLLIIFALALANAAGLHLKGAESEQGNVSIPSVDAEAGRITNGQTAAVGQFPYQAFISYRRSDSSVSWCGASLIDKNWVLSAAHCLLNVEYVTVYLGSIARQSAEIKHTVSKSNIITHSGFTYSGREHDIALIKIPSVTFSDKIQPVKLPSISSTYNSYTGYKAFASGWGQTSDYDYGSYYLQWARMEIISNDACARYMNGPLTANHVCVSTTGGISTCYGDSGGPLVLENDNIQIGISSFIATHSCVKGLPAAFTRLTRYLDWIKYHSGISY